MSFTAKRRFWVMDRTSPAGSLAADARIIRRQVLSQSR